MRELLWAIVALLGFLAATIAHGQTVPARVKFAPMLIDRIELGLWQAAREPGYVSIDLPQGKASGTCYIDETYVDGLIFRAVRPCSLRGLIDAGEYTLNLPRERVSPFGTARPILMKGHFVEWSGKTWRLSIPIGNCRTHFVKPLRTRFTQRLAPEISAEGTADFMRPPALR